jgi:hypothetical protein
MPTSGIFEDITVHFSVVICGRFFPVWDTTEEVFLQCGIHHRTIYGFFLTNFPLLYPTKQKFFSFVSHTRTVFIFSSVVSLSAKESSTVYPTTQKVLFCCRRQRRKMIQHEIIFVNYNCLILT